MGKRSLLLRVLAHYAGDRAGVFLARSVGRRSLTIPRLVDVKLTFRCNLRCEQCGEWRKKPENDLSVSDWKRIFMDIRRTIGPFYLRFYGGEPFIYEGLADLLSFCSDNDIGVLVTTNGTLIDGSRIEEAVRRSVLLLNLSLDGNNARTHDTLRGCEGVFDKAMSVIDRFGRDIAIELNTTVMDNNIDELVDLALLAKQKKVFISYQAVVSYLGRACSIGTDKDDVFPKDIKKTLKVLDQLAVLRRKGYPIVTSVVQLERMKSYYSEGFQQERTPCEAIGHHLRILPDGRLNLCPWSKPVGDLTKEPLQQIWNGTEVSARLKEMRQCEKVFCRVMRGGHKETFADKLAKLSRLYLRG